MKVDCNKYRTIKISNARTPPIERVLKMIY